MDGGGALCEQNFNQGCLDLGSRGKHPNETFDPD